MTARSVPQQPFSALSRALRGSNDREARSPLHPCPVDHRLSRLALFHYREHGTSVTGGTPNRVPSLACSMFHAFFLLSLEQCFEPFLVGEAHQHCRFTFLRYFASSRPSHNGFITQGLCVPKCPWNAATRSGTQSDVLEMREKSLSLALSPHKPAKGDGPRSTKAESRSASPSLFSEVTTREPRERKSRSCVHGTFLTLCPRKPEDGIRAWKRWLRPRSAWDPGHVVGE